MLHYLSVHDLVWINATITGLSPVFDYEALEEMMAAQYSYGDSSDVQGQAAFFLEKCLTLLPFQSGNLATGFVACLAYMSANKLSLKVDEPDAVRIVRSAASGEMSPTDAISALAEPSDVGLRPGASLRALVTYLLNQYPEALRRLASEDPEPTGNTAAAR